MPTCQECESWVSEQFAKVFARPETGEPEACIECAGKTGMAEALRQ